MLNYPLFLVRAFESPSSSRNTYWNNGLHCIRISKIIPTDFSDNANKTSVFVSGWLYAESFFVIPWSFGQIVDWRVWSRSRAQVGWPSCHGDRRDRGRPRSKFKNMKFTWLVPGTKTGTWKRGWTVWMVDWMCCCYWLLLPIVWNCDCAERSIVIRTSKTFQKTYK